MNKLILTLMALLIAISGYSQDQPVTLEEMTVTANKTEEDPQNIPSTISVFSDVDVSDKSIKETKDIFMRIPNMHLTKMGPTGGFENIASIRGITSFMTGGSVFGMYIDEVYQPSFDINFIDVERIEVLRGPQGTLYGRNSEAGVINIISKEPENKWTAEAKTSYSSYNTKELFLAGNGALIQDKLFMRLAGKYKSSDGFFENTANGDDDVNKGTNLDGKAGFKFKPSVKLTADLNLHYQNYDSNYSEFSTFDKVQDGDFEVSVDNEGDVERDFLSSSLKIAYDMQSVRFTSITSALNNEFSGGNDVDFTKASVMDLLTEKDSKIYSQELRLNSLSKTSPLKWTTGLYFYKETNDQKITFDMIPYNVSSKQIGDTEKAGAAIFGQADYTIGKFLVTAGLRYESEHQEFDYEWKDGAMMGYEEQKGSTDDDFSAIMPKAAISYRLTPEMQTYASVSRGFKSGGFNLSSDPGKSYDSEYTWNYEIGFKSKLADNKVMLNAAIFYIDWQDLQVEQPSYPDYIIDNAAEATSKGFELEARALPVSWLDIYGSYGYADAEFDEYKLNGVDYSGKNVPNAPNHTYSLGTTMRFLDHWFFNTEVNGTGKIYYNTENSKEQTSYEIVNLKVGYETERFDIYLWAANILDEAYSTRAFEMSGNWYARSGDPRTVGIEVGLRF